MDDQRVQVLLNSLIRLMQRRQSVRPTSTRYCRQNADLFLAKFTNYMYGGRPLGLSYVKYVNANGNGGDAMEGTEITGGLTQDQIM